MKRSDLVARLAQRHPALLPKDAQYAVQLICDAMARVLREGNRIEIRGFGSFGLTYRRERLNRNPKTGERVQVPAKYVPHFKTGKELRQTLVAQTARRAAPSLSPP
jgi:integration host factor subunit beta